MKTQMIISFLLLLLALSVSSCGSDGDSEGGNVTIQGSGSSN